MKPKAAFIVAFAACICANILWQGFWQYRMTHVERRCLVSFQYKYASGAWGFGHDITQMKMTPLAMRDEREKLQRHLGDSISGSVIITAVSPLEP